jgi:NADH dehydrogenase
MAIVLNSSASVTLFGGSGFLGRFVVQALAQTGCRIRVASRRPDLAGHLQPLGNVGQIAAIQANLRNEKSIWRAIEGMDAVINLGGILQHRGKQSFEAIHVQGAASIAQAAHDAGIQTLVHISAMGANRLSRSAYARTKAEGEDVVRKAFPSAVILRPSVIFGPGDRFFNRFGALAQMSPLMPLIGSGKTRFQPVYAGDVAAAIVSSLDGHARAGETYELGGPSIYTFRELLEFTVRSCERKRPFFPIPFSLAKLQGAFLQILPDAPLTVDQVRMLQTDNVVNDEAKTENRTLEGLGIHAHTIETIVPQYLSRFRPKGEFRTYPT